MPCLACRYARRNLVALLAGATAAPLAACSDPGQLGGALVSPQQERQMGAEEFAQIRQELPRSTNVAYEHELQSVGQRIVAVSGSPIPPAQWDFVPVHGFETPICAYAAMGIGPS